MTQAEPVGFADNRLPSRADLLGDFRDRLACRITVLQRLKFLLGPPTRVPLLAVSFICVSPLLAGAAYRQGARGYVDAILANGMRNGSIFLEAVCGFSASSAAVTEATPPGRGAHRPGPIEATSHPMTKAAAQTQANTSADGCQSGPSSMSRYGPVQHVAMRAASSTRVVRPCIGLASAGRIRRISPS